MKSPIIIIGMHRSGTSWVADTLNKAGVFMGAFRDHNGEALHFLSLNQQMLAAAGGSWLEPIIPEQQHDKTLDPESIFAEHIKATSIASSKMHVRMDWGWKDPRNTYTLKLWLNRFPNAKVLHIIRDGRAVAMSLKNRNNIKGEVQAKELENLTFNFLLWEKYVTQGMSFSKLGTNYHQVKYEDLVERDASSVTLLESFIHKSLSNHLRVGNEIKIDFPTELNDLASKSEVFQKLGYTL